MFKKIGTGETGAPLVLCELNKDEREALELILIEAQRGWDTNRRRYGTRRGLLLKMTMDGLREEFGIEPPAPSPDREDSR